MKHKRGIPIDLMLPKAGAIAIALLVICLTQLSLTALSQAKSPSAWASLQQGKPGYVVMMRHALAPGTGDPPTFNLGDCSTQRNLSAKGREQAVQLAKEFRDRNIQIAKVLSSQWCRCLDTAKLMDLGKVKPFPALNSFFNNPSLEARQTAEIRQFIIDNRSTQGVIIMVSHQVNITALTNIVPQSGESVVLRASEQGQVGVVGRLPAL